MSSDAASVRSAPARGGAPRSRPRRRARRYLPPQHGAWAFLVLPLALGAVVSPATPLLLLLAVTWVAAYPLSYAALGLLRSRHPRRFVRPLLGWLAVVAVGAAGLLLLRPWLVWVGAAYLALFAVHAGYARRNNERALANDLVFVLECASMVWVTWATAAGGSAWRPPAWSVTPARVVVLAAVCALVLAGSTLHVKSLIRERRDRRYATAARWFALASVAASAALATRWGLPAGWWLVVPFVVLAVRTEVVPRRSPRPAVIGLVELGCLVLVWLCAVLAAR